jgi:transposase, IS30 family
LKTKTSQPCIAQILGVHKSTISRELRRNQGAYAYFPVRFALDRRKDKSFPRISQETRGLGERLL